MTFAPGARRERKEFNHSSHILSLVVSESASSLVLIGSSIIIKLAGFPVTPDNPPREIIQPILLDTSNSVLESGDLAVSMPNISPNSLILNLFLRPNFCAKSSL